MTLTFDLLTLNFYGTRVSCVWTLYKIWAKSNNPRLSYWRFSTFSRAILRGWGRTNSFLRDAWIQLHHTWQSHRAIIAALQFVSDFVYLAAFSNAGGSKLSYVLNVAKFRTFWPLWKLRQGGRDLYTNCWSLTYDRTSEIHLMAIYCAAAEHGGLIKTKKSSWIKLLAFPTNVGRPNKTSAVQ